MKPYRKDHVRLIRIYQETAADWAEQAMVARVDAIDIDAGDRIALAIEAAAHAAFWSAAARDLYDEFLERERTNNWLRAE